MTESKEYELPSTFMGEELLADEDHAGTMNPSIYTPSRELFVLMYRFKKQTDGHIPYCICLGSFTDPAQAWEVHSNKLPADNKVSAEDLLEAFAGYDLLKARVVVTKPIEGSTVPTVAVSIGGRVLGKDIEMRLPMTAVSGAQSAMFSTAFLMQKELRRMM